MDRIISPAGQTLNNGKMVNVNTADENMLYAAIRAGLLDADPNSARADKLAAQLAANIVDLRDRDARITVLPTRSTTCYGFEAQPFVSEIAFSISENSADDSTNNHFAIEFYNPFNTDIPLGDFRLELRDSNDTVVSTINLTGHGMAPDSRFVVTNSSAASSAFGVANSMSMGRGREDPNLVLARYTLVPDSDPPAYTLSKRYNAWLLRRTLSSDIYLDKQETQDSWFDWNTSKNKNDTESYCRADGNWNIVYQDFAAAANNTLGAVNESTGGRKNYNLADSVGHFVSVGDIARALTVAPSTDPCDMIGVRLAPEPAEELVRLDLRNPAFANIFQYLTVIDPTNHGHDPDETRIKGRINVNTAPWYVIAQLPWMEPAVAQAIVGYRDTIAGAFESTGELAQVPEMSFYGYDSNDLKTFPDLTRDDNAADDFEERNVIFSRISNLVTVRSDVFTAYILVRIGTDGPQKRVIAILDRSQVYSSDGKVKVVALHAVPDPR
jgi:DNA uptake protein ComE-like DNA-binding protein